MSQSEALYTKKKQNRKKPPYEISFQMIIQSVKSVSECNMIKHAFITSGLHCFHHVQKGEADSLSLTFNDRLKSNFFNIDDVNSKFILNPIRTLTLVSLAIPSNTTAHPSVPSAAPSAAPSTALSSTKKAITDYFQLIYHSENNQNRLEHF